MMNCIEQVHLFNEIAGNTDLVTQESLVAQANVVEEEGKELLEAALEGDPNEILKECIDCLVVAHGFAQLLIEQGYDVIGAWNAVNLNNISKFPSNPDVALASVRQYEAEGISIKLEQNLDYGVYVLRDENGKVRKPIEYKKANVSFYTPKGILPKMKIDPMWEGIV